MRAVQTRAPLWVALIAGLSVLGGAQLLKDFGPPLFINETPSEPKGIYRLVRHAKEDFRRGMYVIFPVPDAVRNLVYGRGWLRSGVPFLKELLGLPGDRVCISSVLTINESRIGPVFERDRQGMALPRRRGCFVIPSGCFLAASAHLPNSFDGRYFGALPLSSITGEARPVWIF